jgi:hypothetical protein
MILTYFQNTLLTPFYLSRFPLQGPAQNAGVDSKPNCDLAQARRCRGTVLLYVRNGQCVTLRAREKRDFDCRRACNCSHCLCDSKRKCIATSSGLSPQAVVGNIVLPIQSINPISISIDGEFVGHAMTGFAGIKPVYVLPHGKHKFEFSCEGFRTSKSELTVIGTGSKQYLIVKLEPNNAVSPEKATSVLPESNNPE